MQHIVSLLDHYGYIVLFLALFLELIALPIPCEILMTYCGYLVYQQKLNWFLSIYLAAFGAIVGITISHFIGRYLGNPFFQKYGHYFHLGPKRFDMVSKWFNKYGNKLLAISYFIPGVRHLTGYFSGITKVPFKEFAIFAYIGAFLYAGTFISLGKIFGPKWDQFHTMVTKYLTIGALILGLILIIIYLYKKYKVNLIKFTIATLKKSMKTFHSLGSIKIAILGVLFAFLGFSALVVGFIEDFLSNDFDQIDELVTFLVKAIFEKEWIFVFNFFGGLTSLKVLIPVSILLFIWVMKKDFDKFLEARFIFWVIGGGEFLQIILRNVFKRLGPSWLTHSVTIKYTFPSDSTFMAIVVYGFIAFMIIRHTKNHWPKTFSVALALTLCIIAGINPILFDLQYPSDVFAGYVFGGVWLSLNIILLEVFRVLPKIQSGA